MLFKSSSPNSWEEADAFSSPTPTVFFYLFMFLFYHNGIWNHVRLDKNEGFAVPGINDVYAHKILIYAGKKDVKYNTVFSKWVIIIGLMN